MTPTFLNFYRLRQQPFGVSPDPAFLYLSRTHTEALTSLAYGIRDGRGFFALIAEPGMGKTTLLYQLLEGLRDYARTAFLFQTQCDSREFFQYVLSELGVDAQGMGLVAMHNKLNEILFAEMLGGKRFVLIVDEAQDLEDSVLETIRLLSNYETWHTKLLQIVLAGQPELAAKLAEPRLVQLLQRLTVLNQLERLTSDETASYIEHRLKVAGYSGDPLFRPEALALIAERSQGIPRNINKICFNALSEGCGQRRRTITAEIVQKAADKLEIGPIIQSAPAFARSFHNVFSPSGASSSHRPLAESRSARKIFWAVVLVCALLSLAGLASLSRSDLRSKLDSKSFSSALGNSKKQDSARQVLPAIVKAHEQDSSREFQPKTEIGESRKSNRGNTIVTNVQTLNEENHTRIVVTLDNPVEYDSGRLSSPDLLYFDLYKAKLSSLENTTVQVDNGLLTSVRAAQNGDNVRLVLRVDLAKTYLAHMEWNPYRLVIDLYGKPIGLVTTAATNPSSPDPAMDKSKPNITIQPSESMSSADENSPLRRAKIPHP